MKKILISTEDLSDLLEISDRMIRKHAKTGLFQKIEKGKFDLKKSVQAYIKMSRENNKSDQAGLTEERRRLTRLQADKVKYELEILRKENWPIDIIKETGQSIVKTSSVKLLSITHEIKRENPEIENKILLSIDKIIRKILTDIGNIGIPTKLRKHLEQHTKNVDPSPEPEGE